MIWNHKWSYTKPRLKSGEKVVQYSLSKLNRIMSAFYYHVKKKKQFKKWPFLQLDGNKIDAISNEQFKANDVKKISFFPNFCLKANLFIYGTHEMVILLKKLSSSPFLSIGFNNFLNGDIRFFIVCNFHVVAVFNYEIELSQFLKDISASRIIGTNCKGNLDKLNNDYKTKLAVQEVDDTDEFKQYLNEGFIAKKAKYFMSHTIPDDTKNYNALDFVSACFSTVAAFFYFAKKNDIEKTEPLPMVNPINFQNNTQSTSTSLKLIPSNIHIEEKTEINRNANDDSENLNNNEALPFITGSMSQFSSHKENEKKAAISITSLIPNQNQKEIIANAEEDLPQNQLPLVIIQPQNPEQSQQNQPKVNIQPLSLIPPKPQNDQQQIVNFENPVKEDVTKQDEPKLENENVSENIEQNSPPNDAQPQPNNIPETNWKPVETKQSKNVEKVQNWAPKQNHLQQTITISPENIQSNNKIVVQEYQPIKKPNKSTSHPQLNVYEKLNEANPKLNSPPNSNKPNSPPNIEAKTWLPKKMPDKKPPQDNKQSSPPLKQNTKNNANNNNQKSLPVPSKTSNKTDPVSKETKKNDKKNKRKGSTENCAKNSQNKKYFKEIAVQVDKIVLTDDDDQDDDYCDFISSSINSNGIGIEKAEISPISPLELNKVKENPKYNEVVVDANFWRQIDMIEALMRGTNKIVFDESKCFCKMCNKECKSYSRLLQHCFEFHKNLLDSFD